MVNLKPSVEKTFSERNEKNVFFKDAIENLCLYDKLLSSETSFKNFEMLDRFDNSTFNMNQKDSWQIPNFDKEVYKNVDSSHNTLFSDYFNLNFKVVFDPFLS